MKNRLCADWLKREKEGGKQEGETSIFFGVYKGARQAEGLKPLSCRTPLTISKNS